MRVCIFAATLSALHQEYGESPRLGNGELARRDDPVTSVVSDTGERPVAARPASASKQDAEREITMSGPVAAAATENISKEKHMESSNTKR